MEYRIQDKQRFDFTIIPNEVMRMKLSHVAFKLYCHLKMVAGDDGSCWQSGETISENTGISTGAISKAKKELEEAGLIKIERKANDRFVFHDITIVDLYKYKDSPSPNEELPSSSEEVPSPRETNKIKLNKTYVNKSAAAEVNQIDENNIIDENAHFKKLNFNRQELDFLIEAVKIFWPMKIKVYRHAQKAVKLYNDHGKEKVLSILEWGADKEMVFGEAVSKCEKLIDNWDNKVLQSSNKLATIKFDN